MLARKIESNQKLCNEYINLLHQRKNFEIDCREKLKGVEEEEMKKIDNENFEEKLKVRHVLRDYIKELNDELELLMMIQCDVTAELFEKQRDCLEIEEVLKVQKKALEAVEQENQHIERKTNEEISLIREKFLVKWAELKLSREDFIKIQRDLEETCKIKNDLESELNQKKKKHKRNLCCIKTIRKKFTGTGDITPKMIDNMTAKKEKFKKKSEEMQNCLEYYQQQICKLQGEHEISRKTLASRLTIAKHHDEWKIEKLLKRKEKLEEEFDSLSETCDDRDKIIMNLRKNIKSAENDVRQAQASIENLKKLLIQISSEESCCKKIIRPSTKGKPTSIKKPLKTAIATDYLGSNFIKTH